ncbi:MAG TPA: mercury resistance system periplasmic binding protein MerP [Rhodospirillaceae bacterium]|nr:mercury resistance system periplasmic binding protein MerP [Rhodospirillaceae bacterium]
MVALLAVVAVLLVLCCGAFGFQGAGAASPQSSEAVSVSSETRPASFKTVTLDVPGMTCASCPFIVKKTLSAIDGVSEAESSFETKSATVTFDENKTNIDALLEALKNKGYPSSIAKTPCENSETGHC